ncbi:MAG: thiamine diphosphokinase [Lachnospiraceae bacterium]|nr:thiamine diphosphokinase [Lachnospiraceae bacterium]
MDALIISGGSLDQEFARSYIRSNPCELTIAVDVGMKFFYDQKMIPDFIVGDFDSVEAEILRSFQRMEGPKKPVVLQFQPEKDETDTELAIRTAIREGSDHIHLLGAAAGNRMDHLIGNIHLLGAAMRQGVNCQMADPKNRVRMISEGIRIKRKEQYGNYVSLFPFTPEVKGLTLTGFKYPLSNYTLECFHSLGVSNEIVEAEAEISFQEGILLVIESQD